MEHNEDTAIATMPIIKLVRKIDLVWCLNLMSVLGKLFCFDLVKNMEFLDKFLENGALLTVKIMIFVGKLDC